MKRDPLAKSKLLRGLRHGSAILICFIAIGVWPYMPAIVYGAFDQISSGAPLQPRSYAENNGEEGDNPIAVPMQPHSAASTDSFIQGKETADVFLRGAAAFMMWMWIYAGLKRW